MKKNNNVVKKICILALSISFLLSNLVYAEAAIIWAGQGGDTIPPIAMADMAATVINQTQPIANVVGDATTINNAAEGTVWFSDTGSYKKYGDSGLTKSQATSMTFQEGYDYIKQRYQISGNQTPGNVFIGLWRQILKEEFPEALSNGSSPDGLHWILSAGYGNIFTCSFSASEYIDGRFFMQKSQKPVQECKTFAEFREYVKDCDKILREKGYY